MQLVTASHSFDVLLSMESPETQEGVPCCMASPSVTQLVVDAENATEAPDWVVLTILYLAAAWEE